MCKFINNDIECKYKGKGKYDNYCFKHRRGYLITNERIDINKYTNQCSDYLKNDILNTLFILKSEKCRNNFNKNYKGKNKKELFCLLDKIITDVKGNENYKKEIIYIQRFIKYRNQLKHQQLHGEGFINKELCNNTVDFYSFDTMNEIDDIYFFSYKDNDNFIWFFDIRSFDKLIQMNEKNPYTRKEIPTCVIDRGQKLIQYLKSQNIYGNLTKEIKRNRKDTIKQKTIDLFSQIEQFGYECQIGWFLNLNIRRLKRLYKSLEDIWNYRLQLTQEMKNTIVPPNGEIFTTPVNDVLSYNNLEDVQDLILNNIMKFNNAINDSDKKLGFMYFMIGLGSISYQCLDSHPWILYVGIH